VATLSRNRLLISGKQRRTNAFAIIPWCNSNEA
jgi:hypothetical protein